MKKKVASESNSPKQTERTKEPKKLGFVPMTDPGQVEPDKLFFIFFFLTWCMKKGLAWTMLSLLSYLGLEKSSDEEKTRVVEAKTMEFRIK